MSGEYLKSVEYKGDIKIDRHGVAVDCQCAAWVGPDVRRQHVSVVYCALTKVKEGILTKETRTQQLQTIYQAKEYTGSPVKMQDKSVRTKSGHSIAALK